MLVVCKFGGVYCLGSCDVSVHNVRWSTMFVLVQPKKKMKMHEDRCKTRNNWLPLIIYYSILFYILYLRYNMYTLYIILCYIIYYIMYYYIIYYIINYCSLFSWNLNTLCILRTKIALGAFALKCSTNLPGSVVAGKAAVQLEKNREGGIRLRRTYIRGRNRHGGCSVRHKSLHQCMVWIAIRIAPMSKHL